jgi:hypothetical protein
MHNLQHRRRRRRRRRRVGLREEKIEGKQVKKLQGYL